MAPSLLHCAAALLAAALPLATCAKNPRYVIAHRGASGAYPEHTIQGYQLAVDQGTDFIECDVVLTKDKKPICRHEPLLSGTTDADKKFPELNTTKVIDGREYVGVFSTDLTLEQVKTLRAIQPNPLRSKRFDGKFEIPTLQEYIQVALGAKRPVGIYPETKHPTWHDSLPFMGEDTISGILLKVLKQYGYKGGLGSRSWKKQPCFIQSFESGNLKTLKTQTNLPLVQLLSSSPAIVDEPGSTLESAGSGEGLAKIAKYASGVGPSKDAILPPTEDGYAGASTGLVQRVHDAGMQIHPYTYRNEYVYLKWNFSMDAWKEYYAFFEIEGIDGAFTDFPSTQVKYHKRIALGKTDSVNYPTEPWNALTHPRCPVKDGKDEHEKHHKSGYKRHQHHGKQHHKSHHGRRLMTAHHSKCVGGITDAALSGKQPFVIGHRGSCGVLPEHTVEAYSLAVEQGADFIECDVVVTKDKHLICRHEPLLSNTTNADDVFPDRKKNYTIDGTEYTGVFSVDLTLAEIKTLKARQRVYFRDPNYDDQFEIPTLDEYITVALTAGKRSVGIYPETKHPTWHDSLDILKGTSISELLLTALKKRGYGGDVLSEKWAAQPVFIQSFEVTNLKYLSKKTDIPLVQLTDSLDATVPDLGTTYSTLLTAEGLADIAKYATGVGPFKGTLIPTDPETNLLGESTNIAELIHDAGLQMHPYTLRNEGPVYLAHDFYSFMRNEYDLWFKEVGFDGAFTDFPGTLRDYMIQGELEGYEWDKLVDYGVKFG